MRAECPRYRMRQRPVWFPEWTPGRSPCFAWTYLFQKLSTAFIRRFRSVVT